MRTYHVSSEQYFAGIDAYLRERGGDAERHAYDFTASRRACERPMKELIAGFRLAGKSIVSVAPNFGHEEAWFADAGCSLRMIDIDEHGLVEPYLRTLPPGDLAFTIGDARNAQSFDADAVYISSFTPDELYKAARVDRARGPLGRLLFRVGYKVRGPAEISAPWFLPIPTWQGEPFHPLMMELLAKVPRGPLVLIQSYAGMVVPSDRYAGAVREQLREAGLTMLALYGLRVKRHVHLIVAAGGASGIVLPQLAHLAGRQSAEDPEQGVDLLY